SVATAKGKLIHTFEQGSLPRVASTQVIGMMNAMMAGTLDYGSGRSAAFGHPAGGKTGTTQGSRDAWFVGYTARLVTGVWFGNDDGSQTRATGSSLPATAWREFMSLAHQGKAIAALPGGWRPAVAAEVGQSAIVQSGTPEPGSAKIRSGNRPRPPGEVG